VTNPRVVPCNICNHDLRQYIKKADHYFIGLPS
jgi:hypothetical protein